MAESNLQVARLGKNLLFLDGLRGLAALYVVVFHCRWLLWEGYSAFTQHRSEYSPIGKGLVYALSPFKFGHEAVIFFFVLSGFVIHLRPAREIADKGRLARFGWSSFLWRRARRIYPPLLAALALTFFLDTIGQNAGFPIYNGGTPYSVINENVGADLSFRALSGNLGFLMQTYVPVFGSDGPLWSLKFEWWFYMFYPVFWWVSKQSQVGATLLMSGLFFLAQRSGWPVALLRDVFSSMPVWWFGVLLADVFAKRIRATWSATIAVCILLAIVFRMMPGMGGLSLALGFVVLIACGFWAQERGISLQCLEKLKPLGDMSYSLYVLHMPLLVLLSGWIMSRSPGNALPMHFGWAAAGLVISLIVAYGAHFLVELPFVGRSKTIPPSKPSA